MPKVWWRIMGTQNKQNDESRSPMYRSAPSFVRGVFESSLNSQGWPWFVTLMHQNCNLLLGAIKYVWIYEKSIIRTSCMGSLDGKYWQCYRCNLRHQKPTHGYIIQDMTGCIRIKSTYVLKNVIQWNIAVSWRPLFMSDHHVLSDYFQCMNYIINK